MVIYNVMNTVRTRFKLPTHYMDELRPKNNEFVESGSENWVLVNQTNTGKDSDDKRMKRKKVCVENIVLGKVRGGLFFYITHKSDYKFDLRIYLCFFFLLLLLSFQCLFD